MQRKMRQTRKFYESYNLQARKKEKEGECILRENLHTSYIKMNLLIHVIEMSDSEFKLN